MGSVGVPREKIASGGGRNLRLLPKFCTLRSQNLQINLSVKKIDKTICKPIDASFRKTKTCEGAVQKEMAALIILNLQVNSNLLKFKYEQRRKR